MPEHRRDDGGALTSATIFDDVLYFLEALSLPVHQTEDDIDAELVLSAQESGIQDPYRYLCPPQDISRALSTMTLDSEPRSSISIHSQETQSTSFTGTSAPSRTSRDQVYPSERSPAQRHKITITRAAVGVERNDPIADVYPSGVTERPSSSTLSVARSVLSSSSASTASAPRRKRTSGLFGMFRKDSSSCTSRSHHGQHGKGRGLKMDCGHSLSPYAIRIHVQEANQRDGHAIPSCCGIPLPMQALDIVTEKDAAGLISSSTSPSPEPASARDSGYCDQSMSSVELARPNAIPSPPATSTSLPLPPTRRRYEAISIDSALANEAFKSFRTEQKEQFEKVSTFECNQRTALSAYHATSLRRLTVQQDASRDEKMSQHTQDLDHLEELQIIAEHDLRKAQDIEAQNVATALKHMEAYCLGGSQSNPDHPHVVSEEDFKKLDRQRILQQSLPRRQENTINVLRAKQEREAKNKMHKQEQEMDLMGAAHDRERAAEEAEHAREMEKLEALIESRRKRLVQRWSLKLEIWRRDWEQQHPTATDLRLEPESFPVQTTTTKPIPESSALAVYQAAV